MSVLEEIRSGFANLGENAIVPLVALPAPWTAWVYRFGDRLGVAVEAPAGLVVAEAFAGARLHSTPAGPQGGPRHQLCLETKQPGLRNEFAVVCAQFLEPGLDGAQRKELLGAPLGWWARWRELLGNAVREQPAYAALGELLALEHLVRQGEEVTWGGPKAATHDLQTKAASYEVKSTLSRYESRVHVSGQFQLEPSGGQPLHLVLQRFEPGREGDTLDAVLVRLEALGVQREMLEDGLQRLNLPRGSKARSVAYRRLETRCYTVDDSFPRIIPQHFAGGKLPAGIVSIEYDVDMASLPYRAW